MNIPLTAPSSVRRSRKRCAQYVEIHEQLRREIENDRACIAALPEHPEWTCVETELVRDFWRYTAGDIV